MLLLTLNGAGDRAAQQNHSAGAQRQHADDHVGVEHVGFANDYQQLQEEESKCMLSV